MTKYMGYERGFYYGTAGSTAATQLTRARDVTYESGNTQGETTGGGDGSAPPIEVFRVATRTAKVTWNMVVDSADTALTAMLAAARTGVPVAVRLKSAVAAGTGYDGDCNISVSQGAPYKGEQTVDFEATPNDELRTPLLNA